MGPREGDLDTPYKDHSKYTPHEKFITNIVFLPEINIIITGSDDTTLKSWDYSKVKNSLSPIKTVVPSNSVKGKSLIDDLLYLSRFDTLIVANRNCSITLFKVRLDSIWIK